MKKLSLLAFALFLSIRLTAEPINFQGLYYNLSGDSAEFVRNPYGFYFGDKSIPNSITYQSKTYQVTSIGDGAFFNCTRLTSITIPSSVTRIGDNAFENCSQLPSISIGSNVQSIGQEAFSNCTGLVSIKIPNSVTGIGDNAFYYVNNIEYNGTLTGSPWGAKCVNGFIEENFVYLDSTKSILCGCSTISNQHITIPNNVTTIGKSAFANTSLLTVQIPNSVISIEDKAFYGCTYLQSITIGNGIKRIERETFSGCDNLSIVNILDLTAWCKINFVQYYKVVGKKLVSIVSNPLSYAKHLYLNNSEVKCLVIPQNLDTIKDYTFYSCLSIESIIFPNSKITVGSGSFMGCQNVNSITCASETPPVCAEKCFDEISKSIPVYIPIWQIGAYQTADGWKEFSNFQSDKKWECGKDLFWKYSHGKLKLFGTGDMYDFSINNPVPWTEYKDSISSVEIDNGVTSIGSLAFYGFENKELKTIDLPNSITSIGRLSFGNCSWLKTINMGTGMEEVQDSAFMFDQRLIYINSLATEPPLLGRSPFVNYLAYVKVPCDALNEYKVSLGWSSFDNISCIAAEEVPAITDVIVTPTETAATITWPTDANAGSYTLDIKKDGVVFCTLTFNSQGQLMNIAFAPGRGSSNELAATAVAGGYKFTITSLSPGVKYTYNIDTKDAAGTTIKNYTGEFMTKPLTALEETSFHSWEDRGEASKVIKNNQLYILHDGKTYNAQGTEVK